MCAIGVVSGLLLHPAFPDNLTAWYEQNVSVWEVARVTMSAEELKAPTGRELAMNILPATALAGLAMLLGRPWRRTGPEWTALLHFAAFFCLYLTSQRFSEYAHPFMALWGWIVLSRSLNGEWSHARMAALSAAVLVSGIFSLREGLKSIRNGNQFGFEQPSDFEDFRQALPEGARVAAFWDDTPLYAFAAPQALFLSANDPLFMARQEPEKYALLESLMRGEMVDPVPALLDALESDYLAFNEAVFPALSIRIKNDPRFEAVFHRGLHRVYRHAPAVGFIRDWEIARNAPKDWEEMDKLRLEGRLAYAKPVMHPLQAFVGKPSVPSSQECWWASHMRPAGDHGSRQIWFSSAGPAKVYLNGEPVLQTQGEEGAVINFRQAVLDYRLADVWVCPGPLADGFYWRELPE